MTRKLSGLGALNAGRGTVSFVAPVVLLAAFSGAAQATPRIAHWTTPAGVSVYFIENHDLPMLDASVEFAAGSSRDAPERAGVAGLTRDMLAHGAGGLSENEISRRLARLGAAMGGGVDDDRATLTLRTLSDQARLAPALALMHTVLAQPDFPDAVLAREKAQVVAGLHEAQATPDYLAGRAFARALYGTHPYALPGGGDERAVRAIRREDLRAFHRRYYAVADMTVCFVGDITRAQAESFADALAAGLPRGRPVPPLPAPAPQPPATRAIYHPASQAHVLLGQIGVARKDPDYVPLYVGNYILGGGGFSSRLTHEVREKRGLAYSVNSGFDPEQQAGPFAIRLQTRAAQADEAVAVVRRTLADFIRNGPTEAEVRAAKQYLIGGFPLRIDSNAKLLAYLEVIGFYRLPLDWLDELPREIGAVSAAQIRDAFARRVRPARMTLVMTRPDAPPEKAGGSAAGGASGASK